MLGMQVSVNEPAAPSWRRDTANTASQERARVDNATIGPPHWFLRVCVFFASPSAAYVGRGLLALELALRPLRLICLLHSISMALELDFHNFANSRRKMPGDNCRNAGATSQLQGFCSPLRSLMMAYALSSGSESGGQPMFSQILFRVQVSSKGRAAPSRICSRAWANVLRCSASLPSNLLPKENLLPRSSMLVLLWRKLDASCPGHPGRHMRVCARTCTHTRTLTHTHTHTFKLSGNSDRPAYPGFMVMYTEHAGFRSISVSSKMKRLTLAWMDSWMVKICAMLWDQRQGSILRQHPKQKYALAAAFIWFVSSQKVISLKGFQSHTLPPHLAIRSIADPLKGNSR
eukprot:1139524-Pelagomonas_calceolata.AAC.6